ncbi:peptidase inhibitor family I36 protein [Streptomyces sp. NPDC059002]|uniref:peptidase inhibitor family I36 protein n=1 Tax=Streptomyces sp. NPDC059002 TaxID=3346690 RepID=UPI0036CB9D5A
MRVKRVIASSAAAAALAATGLTATAAPAEAAWTCPATKLCAYLNLNGVGDPGEVAGNNTNLKQYAKFAGAESLYNHGTQCSVTVYSELSYGGRSYRMLRGDKVNLNGTAFWHHTYSNKWCV